jgi:hypothetical protein
MSRTTHTRPNHDYRLITVIVVVIVVAAPWVGDAVAAAALGTLTAAIAATAGPRPRAARWA